MLSGGFSIGHWLIVLAVVVAVFGTKKLRTAGGDLGAAIRNFKSAMREGETQARVDCERPTEASQPILARVESQRLSKDAI